MKSVFLLLMVIAGFVTIMYMPNAYSDFSPNNKYVVEASGYLSGNQTIFDSTIALQLTTGTQSGTTLQTSLDNGLVVIADDNYLNSGTWQTPILRDGKYFVIQGDAQDQNGNVIHLNLFGRIINGNPNGSVYSITGKITGSETLRVIYSAKILSTNIVNTKPTAFPTTTPTTSISQPSSNKINISIVYGASDINNQVHYTPSNIQVAPGSTIVWTNNDSVPHHIMSGTAKALGTDGATPVFTADGKIDSGIIAPGQSFQYTVTQFDNSQILSPKLAQLYNISPDQTVGDITFFDPTYQFMVGIISPLVIQPTGGITTQMTIAPGASNSNNGQFLSPTNILTTSGSTITLTNNDSVPHELESGSPLTTTSGGAKGSAPAKQSQFTPDGIFDSGIIAPGQIFTKTVTNVGTLQIFDPSYTWINGVIVVSSPTTTTTPKIAPVQVSIGPGSSLPKGSAQQQQYNQYNSYYYPDTIQLVPGTPITWTNNDSVAHTILSGVSTQKIGNPFTPDGIIQSTSIPSGGTYTAIINGTGIIRFYDPQYTWMNGVIISMPKTQSQIIGANNYNPSPTVYK